MSPYSWLRPVARVAVALRVAAAGGARRVAGAAAAKVEGAREAVAVQPVAAAAEVVQALRRGAVGAVVLRAAEVAGSLVAGAVRGRALVREAEIFAAAVCRAMDADSATGGVSTVAVRASADAPLGTLGDLAEGI